jgi:hypothetical protein
MSRLLETLESSMWAPCNVGLCRTDMKINFSWQFLVQTASTKWLLLLCVIAVGFNMWHETDDPGKYDWRVMAFQRNMIGVLWRSREIWLAYCGIPEEYDWRVMTF